MKGIDEGFILMFVLCGQGARARCGVNKHMSFHRLFDRFVRRHFGKSPKINSFAWFLLLNYPQNTIVQMFIEFLRAAKGGRACGTFPCCLLTMA